MVKFLTGFFTYFLIGIAVATGIATVHYFFPIKVENKHYICIEEKGKTNCHETTLM